MTVARQLALFVDDCPEDLSMYPHLLRQDYELTDAETPAAAFDLIRTSRPVAMLLDYRLPAKDGMAMLAVLAGAGVRNAMAVILLTGTRGDQRLGIKALQAGACDFLEKDSINSELLRKSLANAVEKIRLTPELAGQQLCLRRILQSVGDGVIATDAEAKASFLNPTAASYFGRSFLQAVGRSVASILALKGPDGLEITSAHDAAMKPVLRGETVVQQCSLARVTGGEVWVANFTYSPIAESAKIVVGAVVTIQDMTERKRAEALIQERQHRLTLAFEAGRLASWDWDILADRLIWNDQHYRLRGYQVGEVQPGCEACNRRFHPEDRAHITARFQRASEDGPEYQGEFRSLWPDGTVRWLEGRGRFQLDEREPVQERLNVADELKTAVPLSERALALAILQNAGVKAVQLTPLINRSGRGIGILSNGCDEPCRPESRVLHYPEPPAGQIADLTARNAVERARKESEERLRLFIQVAPATLAMFDRQMRYLAVSQRWLGDFSRTHASFGQCHYEVFPCLPTRWKGAHKSGLAGEVVRGVADRLLDPGGRVQWLRREVRPWCTAEGGVGGIVIFIEDITARKSAAKQLQGYRQKAEVGHQREIVAQTAAAIAHELNQPLNAVCSFADTALRLWRDGNRQPAMLIESLEKAVKQAQRAGRTMRDLHAVRNKAQLDSEPIDLIACLTQAVDRYATRKFRPQIRVAEPVPVVLANRIHVEKIRGMLLTNAVEAMQEAGPASGVIRIAVRHRHPEQPVEVRVCDTGVGIDPELGVEILEPLVTTKRNGSGMDLSLARSLVRACEGYPGIDGEMPSGTCIYFTPPAVQ